MGDDEKTPDEMKEDPITLGFEYLGDLQAKSLQTLKDMKALCEDLKKTSAESLKAFETATAAQAAAQTKLALSLSEFAANVKNSCEDSLAAVKLAREFLEEYKKTPQTQAAKGKKPKSSLSEVAEKIKNEAPLAE